MRKLLENVALGPTFSWMREGDFSRCFQNKKIWQTEGAAEIKGWWLGIEQIHLIFWGSKIAVDGDYSHKLQRHLLLGRKALTNLDSTLPTKVQMVKAMVFPVVAYRCES